jgi:Fanconi anemia group M protein
MLLAETLGIGDGERVIVFTESRDTAEALTAFLDDHFAVRKFVGQSDTEGSEGMTQTEQQAALDAFRAGEFEVLVSTSVAEEGLDVPEVDLVLFYEPVPTAIRSIQRKGRTGRQTEGRVVVLLAEDTRDEAFFWISRRREKRMESELRSLKGVADELEAELGGDQKQLAEFDDPAGNGEATREPGERSGADHRDPDSDEGQSGLAAFAASASTGAAEPDASSHSDTSGDAVDEADEGDAVVDVDEGDAVDEADEGGDAETGEHASAGVVATPDDDVEIVVDQRELDSPIARDLSKREAVETRLETLAVGDYVCSDRVAVERKTVADFLDTLLGGDRSLFEQAKDLTRHYARPVVLVEGDGLYAERNVHPRAIRGALASLAVDFGVSVLHTEGPDDTAEMLATIATREQQDRDREVSVHGGKSAKTLAEQQEYVVSSIADIGPVTARSLLEALGSVEAVMTASREDLLDVEGVGAVTADRIREVVGSEYR